MPSVMLDTNVYTNGAYRDSATRISSLVISGVVVQELLVIAPKGTMRTALISEFLRKFDDGKAVVPDHTDWIEVGKCLYRLNQEGTVEYARLGKLEVNLLVRDALIARTAIRAGALLVTSNTSDFAKIKSVVASLRFSSPTEFFELRPR